ncbi:glycerophosphodiester phosphodiesterase [Roseateles sp. DAIF2]|uniref:glycerophosphodiester phosphodiesterase family protein n=1 Tax=Roseateles sp. DAIF2 TaxID=2714952 RepID=UPI0018A2FD44|nr:glycerophosphodiester phosphodiesterase family protein [Roseateles sp. DAIF2]QPF75864.1 glycerophosphodiester phosphodiesterase [Roseateles sp. DAIF2]
MTIRSTAAALLLGLATGASLAGPLLIGHRGASGHRPEHTLAAYELAIEQGADYIEPDLVMSKDGVLLARHEPLLARVELEADGRTIKRDADGKPVLHRTDTSTNVWQLDKYAQRLSVKQVDGRPMAGWFAEDFSAAEIRADIRAQERLRDQRLANKAYDDRFTIPTLGEVIALAQARGVGIYPETKHPSYFKAFTDAAGLPRLEDRLLETLHAAYGNRADAPVFIQSFEVANLQYLRGKTKLRLVQLLSAGGKPYDFTLAGDARGYADLVQPAGLDFIKRYADGVGAHLNLIIPLVGGQLAAEPTPLVAEAHRRGLLVHGWTFRAENAYLPTEFRREGQALGDMAGQLQRFLATGMDGFFADQPDLGRAAITAAGKP